MTPTTTPAPAAADTEQTVDSLIHRARAAMALVADAPQARIDELVTALAWSLYQPQRARALAELAVRDTGLGNVADKVEKNRRKTFGTLRDLLRAKSVGVIEELPQRGIVKYAKPVGVVAAVTPSTNPVATPVNKAMMVVKGANAIILAPSPAAWGSCHAGVREMRAALARVAAPEDLVQILPAPVTRAMTECLMARADLVVATGSAANVRGAYTSGTPALGVGAGNVPVIIDSSADVADAARKICASKTFDNATSCSAESALIVLDDVYDAALTALAAAGGYLATEVDRTAIRDHLWHDGRPNRELIARDAAVFAERVGLPEAARTARFFMVEEAAFDAASPFADEKLSVVVSVYRAADFAHAMHLVDEVLEVRGRGHSCGIHTTEAAHAARLAAHAKVVRVLVNQAHTFGNGGNFNNGLNFTLSMGCGTWGGNSIGENLNYRHFINITHLVRTIPEDRPDEQELFGAHFAKYGRD